MPQLITKNFRVNTAEEFMNSLVTSSMNVSLYMAISKIEAWANDAAPNTSSDTRQTVIDFWRRMIGGKKLTAYDMSLVVPRIDWAANSVYVAYSDANTNYSQNTYVVTTDYNVYKCIDNNNGANSTIMPTYTTVDTTHTESDGYTWKYLYSISRSDRQRFFTPQWMPVKRLSQNDGSLQWLVQQNATDGAIAFIKVTSGGNSFFNVSNVSVTISGDGTGARASATFNANAISAIVVTNPGSGYSYANVSIADSASIGSNANARVMISPQGGHGSNPVEELGGSNIMINARLKADENGNLTVANYYRQIGILMNPITYGSNTVYSNTSFDQTTTIQLSTGGGNYSLGEYVFQGIAIANSSYSGRVVDWDSTNSIIKLTETNGTPTTSGLLGSNSGTVRFIINTTPPDLTKYSGRLIFLDNITPIQRNSSQVEDIKLIISF